MCPNQKWLIKQICSTSDNIVIYQFHQRQHHPTTPTEQPPFNQDSFVIRCYNFFSPSIHPLLSFQSLVFYHSLAMTLSVFYLSSSINLSVFFSILLLWLCLSFSLFFFYDFVCLFSILLLWLSLSFFLYLFRWLCLSFFSILFLKLCLSFSLLYFYNFVCLFLYSFL